MVATTHFGLVVLLLYWASSTYILPTKPSCRDTLESYTLLFMMLVMVQRVTEPTLCG